MSHQDTISQPPQPPEFKRRIELYPFQYIAIPLLFVIPILALLGVFGEREAETQAANETIAVHVEYSSRLRHQAFGAIFVTLTNQSEAPLESVMIHFDRDYLKAFSQITFTPAVETITDKAYIVELQTLEAGETQAVIIDLRADLPGQYGGSITIETADTAPLTVHLESILFP